MAIGARPAEVSPKSRGMLQRLWYACGMLLVHLNCIARTGCLPSYYPVASQAPRHILGASYPVEWAHLQPARNKDVCILLTWWLRSAVLVWSMHTASFPERAHQVELMADRREGSPDFSYCKEQTSKNGNLSE
jgi:hypothetical protein